MARNSIEKGKNEPPFKAQLEPIEKAEPEIGKISGSGNYYILNHAVNPRIGNTCLSIPDLMRCFLYSFLLEFLNFLHIQDKNAPSMGTNDQFIIPWMDNQVMHSECR